MAPSTGKSPMGTQNSNGSQKISTEILVTPTKVSEFLVIDLTWVLCRC